jgi:Ran GTPase-activating protein (RanGAP) involved in mRNA processing and transport
MQACHVLHDRELYDAFTQFIETGALPDDATMKLLANAFLRAAHDNDAGIEALALLVSANFEKQALEENIYELDLSQCQLEPKDADRIALLLNKLSCPIALNLSHNNLQVEGAKKLFHTLQKIPLHALYLSNNNIGNQGAIEIANLLPDCSKLDSLSLRENGIGADGALKIFQCLSNIRLCSLNLSGNSIGPSGADGISVSLQNGAHMITTLFLDQCDLGDQGAQHIAAALPYSQLATLSLEAVMN